MPYPAIVVANEIIRLANVDRKDLTPMKLQKILYLAYGIFLKRMDERLIDERFEPWEYGPVVRSVYNTFKECGSGNITQPVEDCYNQLPVSSLNMVDTALWAIKDAWDNAKNLSAFTLSAWSHNKNSPWDKAFNSNPRPLYISDDDIKEYFDNFIQ